MDSDGAAAAFVWGFVSEYRRVKVSARSERRWVIPFSLSHELLDTRAKSDKLDVVTRQKECKFGETV